MSHFSERKIHNNRGGYALLTAVLVSSLLLAVGTSVANILLKEIVLSSVTRDSVIAFYAADTGYECALYWNFHYDDGVVPADGKTSAFGKNNTDTWPASGILCNGVDVAVKGGPGIPPYSSPTGGPWDITNKFPDHATTIFKMTFPPYPYCAIVSVTKNPPVGSTNSTTVESRGYNTCDISPRRIERAIRVTF